MDESRNMKVMRIALVICFALDENGYRPAALGFKPCMYKAPLQLSSQPFNFCTWYIPPPYRRAPLLYFFLASLRSYNSTTTGNLLSARPCSGRFSFPQEGDHASSPTHRRARHQTLETPQARARRSGRRQERRPFLSCRPAVRWPDYRDPRLCRMWMAGRSGELDSVRQLARKMDRKKQQKKSPEALGETTLTCRKKKETASHCQPLSYSQHRSLPQCVPKSVLDPREACSQTARLLCSPRSEPDETASLPPFATAARLSGLENLAPLRTCTNNAVSAKWLDMEYLFRVLTRLEILQEK